MKAMILASGTGSRLMPYTKDLPKCLVPIGDNTILGMQLSVLSRCNINDIIITTGPFVDTIKGFIDKNFSNLTVNYVHNSLYASTNYIYSMYNCRDQIDDTFILVHGDLLFDASLLEKLIALNHSAVLMNQTVPLPEKDFKGRIIDNSVVKIGIDVFGENAFFLAPLYRLERADFALWMNQIEQFVSSEKIHCYAEDALNEVLDTLVLRPCFYGTEYCQELDTLDDYKQMCEMFSRKHNNK